MRTRHGAFLFPVPVTRGATCDTCYSWKENELYWREQTMGLRHRRGTKMTSMALIPTGQHRRSSSALTENTCMLCSRPIYHTIGASCSAGPFDNELVDPRRLTARVVVSSLSQDASSNPRDGPGHALAQILYTTVRCIRSIQM